jgi:hypothetical protein
MESQARLIADPFPLSSLCRCETFDAGGHSFRFSGRVDPQLHALRLSDHIVKGVWPRAAGGRTGLLRREGMAFMAGSVLAMLALAGVLLGPAGRWRGGGLGLSIAIADDRCALGAGDDRVGAQSDGPV